MKKKILIYKTAAAAALLIGLGSLSACKGNSELDEFFSAMEDFNTQADQDFEALSQVDPESQSGVEDMLAAMDQLAASFTALGEIPVPKEFSAVESLADEAASYMSEAAVLYRQAYADGAYASNVADAAHENYSRAVKRLEYISDILQGEMPTDDGITITTENDAPGFKEDQEQTGAEE